MSEALVALKGSSFLKLEAGTFFWCRCGRSSNQKVALCGGKRTGNRPFCDGAHNAL